MAQRKDLSGEVFGRLTVVKRCEDYITAGGNRYSQYLCKCECGNEVMVRANKLTSSYTNSCGCLRRERMSKKATIHGKSHTKLYRTWFHMRQRCSDRNNKDYNRYGGRGITVCSEWENDFQVFMNWALLNGYSDSLTLDRIDVDSGYYPENCRWSTNIEQMNNTRANHKISYCGQEKTIAEWARIAGLPYNTLYSRLFRYRWPIDKALNYIDVVFDEY